MVTYSLTALSRFQTYFHTEEAEAGPDAFVVRRQLEPVVSILNSARPAAPVVLSVRPAFLWKDTKENTGGTTTLRRKRVASYLRVELARPWYQTGAGECLGVILWDRTGVQPLPEIRSHLTQVGRDPIWQTPEPERWPTELIFSGAIGAARPIRLIDSGSTALALPFQPWFHENGWYADVGLPGVVATSYCPFAKLAVARYQPESIEGCDLSPVITPAALSGVQSVSIVSHLPLVTATGMTTTGGWPAVDQQNT